MNRYERADARGCRGMCPCRARRRAGRVESTIDAVFESIMRIEFPEGIAWPTEGDMA